MAYSVLYCSHCVWDVMYSPAWIDLLCFVAFLVDHFTEEVRGGPEFIQIFFILNLTQNLGGDFTNYALSLLALLQKPYS